MSRGVPWMMDLPHRPTDPPKGGPLGDGFLTAAKVPPKGGLLGDGLLTESKGPPKGGPLGDGLVTESKGPPRTSSDPIQRPGTSDKRPQFTHSESRIGRFISISLCKTSS